MWKGCLAILAAFVVVLLVELRQLRSMELPHAWIAALVLALLATLAIGSIQGLVEAWTRRAKPESRPEEWRDGELVRLGGVVRGAGDLLTAPFSGRQVVFYQYWATEVVADSEVLTRQAVFRGMDQAPCVLDTAYGRVRLTGVPRMREFLPVNHDSDAIRERMASLLARVSWRAAPRVRTLSAEQAGATFANEGGELPMHLMNELAVELLAMRPGQTESHYRERLATRHWICQERIVDDGEEVTVVGTFRAAEGAIDLGQGAGSRAEHEMLPGGSTETAARNLTTTVAFAIVLAALAGAAHYVAYSDDGALVRALLDRLGSSG